jgi:hypothetical protein
MNARGIVAKCMRQHTSRLDHPLFLSLKNITATLFATQSCHSHLDLCGQHILVYQPAVPLLAVSILCSIKVLSMSQLGLCQHFLRCVIILQYNLVGIQFISSLSPGHHQETVTALLFSLFLRTLPRITMIT